MTDNATDTVKTAQVKTPDGMYKVAVRVFGKVQDPSDTTTVSNLLDPFDNQYTKNEAIRPPYDFASLALYPEICDSLSQSIDVMKTNVDGFGWELVPHGVYQSRKDKDTSAADEEKDRLSMLFNYPNSNLGQDLTGLCEPLREDYEAQGNAAMEVVRSRQGNIAELYYAPIMLMRLTPKDTEFTRFVQKVPDESGEYRDVVRFKRFRRIVQITDSNRKCYFKEFGDPRVISPETGAVIAKSGQVKGAASEIIWFSQGCSYSPYGVPRWVANMMGILGGRKAESVNYSFFDNKSIPPLLITVSGGSLSPESLTILQDAFRHEIKGIKNFHKALVLDAEPADIGEVEGEKAANVRIEAKPLTQFIQSDAQFLKYRDAIDASIAGSFRFSQIFRGKTKGEFNRATVFEAVRAGEQQVFIPERRKFDRIITNTILAGMGIKYWDFRTKGAITTDYPAILKAITGVKEALPVAVIHEIVAEMRNKEVGDIPDELYDTLLINLRQSALPPPGNGNDAKPKDDDQAPPDKKDVKKTVRELLPYLQEMRKSLQGRVEDE